MKKSIKKLVVLFLLVITVIQLSTIVFAQESIPAATDDFYVNDFAGIFSDTEKSRLIDNAVALSNEHDGIQVVVTTILSLNGDTVENYATKMYNQYGIGKNDMGLLILLSTEDRQIRIEVGKAMEGYINDSKAGRFLDKYAIPYLKDNKFAEGLISLQEELIKEITEKVSNTNANTSEGSVNASLIFVYILFAFIILVIIAIIVFAIMMILSKIKMRKQEYEQLEKSLKASEAHFNELCKSVDKDRKHYLERIETINAYYTRLGKEYNSLEKELNTLKDRYNRVLTLYPSADKEVDDMIEKEIREHDMQIAKNVDFFIQEALCLSASAGAVSQLYSAKQKYSNLTSNQKSYIKSDVNKLNQLYEESLSLKKDYDKKMEEEKRKKAAATAATSILAIISYITVGKAKDLRKLKEAKTIYDRLPSNVRQYFDDSILRKLNKLYDEAKRDKEREDEEERRKRHEEEERRRRMYNSSQSHSSISTKSHFSGFGGHSGGGGASRHF